LGFVLRLDADSCVLVGPLITGAFQRLSLTGLDQRLSLAGL
jgi:hypothetical protein